MQEKKKESQVQDEECMVLNEVKALTITTTRQNSTMKSKKRNV